jgi:hypothetical protein
MLGKGAEKRGGVVVVLLDNFIRVEAADRSFRQGTSRYKQQVHGNNRNNCSPYVTEPTIQTTISKKFSDSSYSSS